MTKNKRKPKNEDKSSLQQIVGCGNVVIRLLACMLMLIFIGMTVFLFYMKSVFPEFDIVGWVVMASFFAYLCGYVAFNQSKEKLPHKPKAIGYDVLNFVRFIAWVGALFLRLISGVAILLSIGMMLQFPDIIWFVMLIICIVLTILFSYAAKVLRPVQKSGSVQNVLDEDKLKNDWLKDYHDESDNDE